MSSFGIALVWCAIQITIVLLVAIAADMLLRRQGRAYGSTILMTGLCGALVLTAIVWSPWPRWSWPTEDGVAANGVTELASDAGTTSEPQYESTASPQPTDSLVTETPQTPTSASDAEWSLSALLTVGGELWQGWQYELNHTAATVEQPTAPVWPKWVGILIACGIGVSLVRLVLGLWAIRRDRLTSRTIDSPQLGELCDLLRAELSIAQPVELRESPRLATAATFGWKRPVILLPLDWKTWDAAELRAVLAHELCHISRRHFPVWVMAQTALSLHFYHPFMHWIVGRLRLAQEIEADADAALVNGGRRTYLESLAALAIRQADAPVSWPARAFLPTRRTFLRRIEMLRSNRPLRAPSGVMTFIACGLVLAGVTFAAGVRDDVSQFASTNQSNEIPSDNFPEDPVTGTPIGIPGPPQLAQTFPSGLPESAEANADGPIVLSHIPRDAVVVAAIRPAKLVRVLQENADFAPTLAALNPPTLAASNDMAVSGREQMLQLFLRAEQITFTMTAANSGPNLPEPPFAVTLKFLAPADLDVFWQNVQAEEVTNFANTSYRGGVGPERLWQIDDRTVMVGSEPIIRAAILSGPRVRSDLVQGEAWQTSAAEAHAMVAIDVAFAARALPIEMSPVLVPFTPIWEETDSLVASIAFADSTIETVARLACSNPEGAEQVRDTLQAVVTLAGNALEGYQSQMARVDNIGGPGAEMQSFFGTLLMLQEDFFDSLELTVADETVTLTAAYEIDPSMYAALFQGVAEARTAAIQAQQQNNLRQIGLALHNYHDVYGHFPPAAVVDPASGVPRSWRVEILPFIEQAALYEQYRKNEPWDSDHNKQILEQMPQVYAPLIQRTDLAPMDHHTGVLAIVGEGTGFAEEGQEGLRIQSFLDGTSNTLLVVESPGELFPWTKPVDLEVTLTGDEIDLGGLAGNAFQALYCDGSVRALPSGIPEETLRVLLGRADGIPVPPFEVIHGGGRTETYLVPTLPDQVPTEVPTFQEQIPTEVERVPE